MPETPKQPTPGWYLDGSGGFRWWDGSAWKEPMTEQAPIGRQPPQQRDKLFVVGVALLLCSALAMMVAGLSFMGGRYPISRAGVSSDGDGVVIVNAVCPGERVVEITLWRRTDSGPYEELWRIAGDAPLPERLDLGAVPDGIRTATPLRRPSTAQEPLSLKVVTSELDSPYSMDFTLEDIPSQGVLSFGDVYTTDAAFAQAVFDDTPCGDPYSEKGSQQFARITLIAAGGAAVSGVSLVVAARRRRSR